MTYNHFGEKFFDLRTLMLLTNSKKSTLIRLLRKRDVAFFTYQNRRIYSCEEIIEKLSDKINTQELINILPEVSN
jgi:hypothetical protein